jgi:hypothetical protein
MWQCGDTSRAPDHASDKGCSQLVIEFMYAGALRRFTDDISHRDSALMTFFER